MKDTSTPHPSRKEHSMPISYTSIAFRTVSVLSLIAVAISSIQAAVNFDGTTWNNDLGSYPSGWLHGTYHSSSMNTTVGYVIHLPSRYYGTTDRFPVVYMIPGGRGGYENSDFLYLKQFPDPSSYINNPPDDLVLVEVNGGYNAKWMDAVPGSLAYGGMQVETTVIRELIPHIDNTYRTIADKSGRAIQGVSGGGEGTLHLAFKYPELFSSAFAYCPAIDDNAANLAENEPDDLHYMFRDDPNLFQIQTAQNLAASNASNIIAQGLNIHIAVGGDDGLLPVEVDLANELTSLGIPWDAPLDIVPGMPHGRYASIDSFDWERQFFPKPKPDSNARTDSNP